MEETYRLLIEFKTIHPLRFWTAIFIATSLLIYAIWRFSRRKSIIEPITNKRTTLTTVVEKESVKQELETSKEKTTLQKQKTKVYTETLVTGDLEVNEPKHIFIIPTEVKQQKAIPKVETVEVKAKAKPKSEKQLTQENTQLLKTEKNEELIKYIPVHFYQDNKWFWKLYDINSKKYIGHFDGDEINQYLIDKKIESSNIKIEEYGWKINYDKIIYKSDEYDAQCDGLAASNFYFINDKFGLAKVYAILDGDGLSFFLGYIDTNGKRYWSTEKQSIKNQIEIIKSRIEQLPKAKEETATSKGEIDFVNYDISKVQTPNSYPIFRFPKKGTVVRSFRLGNTKRRGFKEEAFQKSIELYFGKVFTVLGNVRLNTGKETRPFEPDIAIIDKSSSNLRIDIEIDEPYAGLTRQPTHCKGEDVNRDTYFVDRGWIVIRFSEYQVHLQESDCLRYIAETIKSAIPNYEIPSQLLNQPSLQVEKLWDIVQSQKWEKAKYREQYLNHIFQSIEEQTETIERDFDEQEIKEEQLVKPTLIGVVDDKKSIAFNLKNKHPRDSRIKFYPEPHIYTIDNTPAPSASTIIAKFFPEFDSVYWANRKAPELGMSPIEVELMWKNKGEAAAKDGTFLHEQIENFYLEQAYERTEEFHLFENFVSEHNHIKPFRTEWRIFDEQHHIAGTIDLISENGNGYEMYDWKRSKKVVSSFNGEPIKNNQWQSGVGQLSDIDDTSYNRYCLQQSLYKYILEKNYGLTVSKMFLIVLYPEYDRYYKVEVPYLKDKAEYILRTL